MAPPENGGEIVADIPEEIRAHYDGYDEGSRLRAGDGRLEEARTRLLLERHLPAPPAVVVDVGGATGVYAHWLAARGYEVHLRDIIPAYVERAQADAPPGAPLATAGVADARSLDLADDTADAVLVMGPLYHLTDGADRLTALAEARRVVRPGGVVYGAAISRYASALDGLWRNLVADPAFRPIVERGLAEGQHRNPTGDPTYFTTAYFHTPSELAAEFTDAGLEGATVLPVEGIGWIMPDFDDRWADAENRSIILDMVEKTEGVAELHGVSQHLLAIGWEPA